jgi:adenylate cyclase
VKLASRDPLIEPIVQFNLLSDRRLFGGMAGAFIELGRFDEAIVAAKRAQRHNPSYSAYRWLASAFAHLGRDAEARDAVAHILEGDPAFTISARIVRGGSSNSNFIEGLRKAGLPE